MEKTIVTDAAEGQNLLKSNTYARAAEKFQTALNTMNALDVSDSDKNALKFNIINCRLLEVLNRLQGTPYPKNTEPLIADIKKIIADLEAHGFNGDIKSSAYYNIGIMFEFIKDKNTAIEYYNKSHSLDPNKEELAYCQIGRIHLDKLEYMKAFDIYETLLKMYEKQKNNVEVAIVLCKQAFCLSECMAVSRNTSESKELKSKCVEKLTLCTSHLKSGFSYKKDRTLKSRLLNELAIIYINLEMLAEASYCLNSIDKKAFAKLPATSQMVILLNRGSLFTLLNGSNNGDDMAKKCFEELLLYKDKDVAYKVLYDSIRIKCLCSLGYLHYSKKEDDLAKKYYLEAHKMSKLSKDELQVLNGLSLLNLQI